MFGTMNGLWLEQTCLMSKNFALLLLLAPLRKLSAMGCSHRSKCKKADICHSAIKVNGWGSDWRRRCLQIMERLNKE
jgi:hypothetical protein